MKLDKLFAAQAELKKHIGYTGEDKFSKMMLAMLVEFMECANDWRGFKYWSENQERKETLLEEYVDGLHFILELGLDLKDMGRIKELPKFVEPYRRSFTIEEQYKQIVYVAIMVERYYHSNPIFITREYNVLFEDYLELGRLLGFEEQQIVDAYMSKMETNHERQDTNY